MAWIWLTLAGLLEIVWAIGLKYTDGFTRLVPSAVTLVAMMRLRSASSNWPSSGQAMAPGATPFTRTRGASSSASARVVAASPALATLYRA